MQRAEAEKMALALVQALESKNMDGVLGMLADDFTLWHNVTGRRLENGAGQAFLAGYFPTMRSLTYSDIRVSPTETGWVQQHNVDSETGDGTQVRNLAAIIVVRAANGKIHAMEEYFDSATVQPPRELLSA